MRCARLEPLGLKVLIESGAGDAAALPDAAYRDAGATVVDSAAELYRQGDIVVRVGRVQVDEVAALRPGSALIGWLWPLGSPELVQALVDAPHHRVRDGVDPAGDPRAADGRAVVAGDRLGLPVGDPGRRGAAQVLPHADDRRRDGRPREGARARRRRRRPAGDRHLAPARRRRVGVRHAAGRQGAGAEPGRGVRGARAGGRRRAGRARLRDRAHPRAAGAAAAAARAPHRRLRRRHHDRARARQAGAEADPRLGRRGDAAGIGDRRPGGRDRRQLRADRARRDGRARRA